MSISALGQTSINPNFFSAVRNLSPQQARNFLDVAPQIAGDSGPTDFSTLSTEANFQLLQPVDPQAQQMYSLGQGQMAPNAEMATNYNALLDAAQTAPNANVNYDDNGLRNSSYTDDNGSIHTQIADPQTGSLTDTMMNLQGGLVQNFERSGDILSGYSSENFPASPGFGEGLSEMNSQEDEGGTAQTIGAGTEQAEKLGDVAGKLSEFLGKSGSGIEEEAMAAGIASEATTAASGTGSPLGVASAVEEGGLLAKVAEPGLSSLALAKSATQLYTGSQEVQQGKVLDGSADLGSGILNAVGGGAGLIGGAASTVAAPIALGGAAIFDGTKDIVNGVNAGDDEKVAVGSAKDLGGGLLVAGGVISATGIGAPIGAAVAGVGGAIVLGASLYENRGQIASFLSNVGGAIVNAQDPTAAAWASSLF